MVATGASGILAHTFLGSKCGAVPMVLVSLVSNHIDFAVLPLIPRPQSTPSDALTVSLRGLQIDNVSITPQLDTGYSTICARHKRDVHSP